MSSSSISSSVSVSISGVTDLWAALYAVMVISANLNRVDVTCLGYAAACTRSNHPHTSRVPPFTASCGYFHVRIPLCRCSTVPTRCAPDECTIFVRLQAPAAYSAAMFHCAIFSGRLGPTPGWQGPGCIYHDHVVGGTCHCLMWGLSLNS